MIYEKVDLASCQKLCGLYVPIIFPRSIAIGDIEV